jgi:hypothetical protein
MVEVRDRELELVQIRGVVQQVEQRHGVGPPGDRDERSPRPQSQGGQVGTEVVDQAHRVSSTSRTLRDRSAGMKGFCRNGAPGSRQAPPDDVVVGCSLT